LAIPNTIPTATAPAIIIKTTIINIITGARALHIGSSSIVGSLNSFFMAESIGYNLSY
jgi:hypothetical protein